MKKTKKGLIAYMIVLCMFTVYVLLDTFVITRVYGDAEGGTQREMNAENSGLAESGQTTNGAYLTEEEEDAIEAGEVSGKSSGGSSSSNGSTGSAYLSDESSHSTSPDTDAVSTENSYKDKNISVTLSEYREYDTTVYVADVEVSSPDYLKTALAQGVYGKNVKENTSDIAKSAGAILAVNGDYYGARESGYVIKNGTLYRDEGASGRDDLVIYKDGSWRIISEDEVSAEKLIADGAVQTMSFGPALLENGEVTVGVNEEVTSKSMASNPRTAIGIIDENHYVFVVSDGRTDDSAGLSLYELADVMKGLGVKTAYNLDGGGSSTMYFHGNVVNNPTGGREGHGAGSERSVSDIVYIGY